MKKLLILTSVRTGGGHVSLTEAVTKLSLNLIFSLKFKKND